MKDRRLNLLLVHLALLLISAGFALPFLWMVSTSLKPLDAVAPTTLEGHSSLSLIPDPVVWTNYLDVIHNRRMDFPLYTRNTLLIAVLAVIGNTLTSALCAYGFAKIRFKGRGLLFAVMLATMMIPFPVVMVSIFSIFRWIGDHTPLQMLGTFRPLWLPAWFGSAFSIFLLRQFFLTLPDELCEAARIDGCSEAGIFFRIMLPLARPALAVVALFTFMGVWNDFLGPLVYLQRPEQFTLALGLHTFQSQHGGTQWNLLMAASVLVILPVIVLFFLTQRTFIQGIATTGMKG
ncbi:MAG: carbohydrate ABC transporter permease [Phycisphaerae bacterium]|nr:carbohydrate ABC transporter permease [Phycisphaerae bacterium]MDW8262643.1 carbohydrate ABC transporter permease [Phycisphaerales bacterium]